MIIECREPILTHNEAVDCAGAAIERARQILVVLNMRQNIMEVEEITNDPEAYLFMGALLSLVGGVIDELNPILETNPVPYTTGA